MAFPSLGVSIFIFLFMLLSAQALMDLFAKKPSLILSNMSCQSHCSKDPPPLCLDSLGLKSQYSMTQPSSTL